MSKNPFTLSFSRRPVEYIDRTQEREKILTTFIEEPVTDQIFIITGIRGSGKTVLMTSIANELENDADWIVKRCINTRNMIQDLADDLSVYTDKPKISASIGIPGTGSLSIGRSERRKSDTAVIHDALVRLNKRKKKLLITVDEISNTPQIQELVSAFQTYIGENLPVYILAAAIPENLDALRNVKYLTFLYRAPRIELEPLDMVSIAYRYQSVLNLNQNQSKELAKMTMGYSFAFQALGYVYWENQPVKNLNNIIPEYDRLLIANSYSKIWSDLSLKQRSLCRIIASSSSNKVADIRKAADMNSNIYNGFQNRLIHQGILWKNARGTVSFALPRFREFILNASDLYEF